MRRIESTQNEQVKGWRALHRRRDRDRRGLCLVEGVRELSRALEGGIRFDSVLLGDSSGPAAEALATAAADGGAETFILSEAAFSKVSVRSNPAPIIGIARSPGFSLDDVALSGTPLMLIADAIEKPGNLGAMIRSADGAGAHAVIASDPVADLVNPNIIRSSQGALFSFPVAQGAAGEVKEWLARHSITVVAATAQAPTELWDYDFTGATAIVVGSEHAGLSPEWHDVPQLAIPMTGVSDSLNASVSAAVLMYEAQRQRA